MNGLTIKQAVDYLNAHYPRPKPFSEAGVRKLARYGRAFPNARNTGGKGSIRGLWLIPQADLDAYIARKNNTVRAKRRAARQERHDNDNT